MEIYINQSSINQNLPNVKITGSKSESNRLLLLQALFPEIEIKNVSNSDDSNLMQQALKSTSATVDIHHAGTAMRFLTAFFATQEGRELTLTGSKRMKERPIKILVDALRALGADITYKENEGFPPLLIKGKNLTKSQVTLKANVSSQYISALLLIASKLNNGLEVTLEGTITSVPYLKMTLSLLDQIGVKNTFKNNVITVSPLLETPKIKTLVVESDWSSVSYFYSIVALSDVGTTITLSSYKQDSLQGDSVLVEIYQHFGVKTIFNENTITLIKEKKCEQLSFKYELSNAPDIAQTIAVTCFGLGIGCELSGLHTLKIKETDRLEALKTEIEKLGGHVAVTDKELFLKPSKDINKDVKISTYNDHRMAMAFAPLALKTSLIIEDAKVVSKSYPEFWKDLKAIGFQMQE